MSSMRALLALPLFASVMIFGTIAFPAVLRKDNIWATQFHPEKSQKVGEKLLANFIAI